MRRPDLAPAAQATAAVVAAIPGDDLAAPTPSAGYRVADLIEHVDLLSTGLVQTARKREVPAEQLRDGDADHLRQDWRSRIPGQLSALAAAWSEPTAWEGDTVQGGVEVPAASAGMFVLTELVVHGWELARATGRPYEVDAADADVLLDFWLDFRRPTADDGDGAAEELFGPVVDVPDSAPALDRVLGLTGRDPGWRPG